MFRAKTRVHPRRTSLDPPSAAAGIVLAGGRSVRFGGNKLVQPYRGMPLLHHSLLRLGELCSGVVVVLSPEAEAPDLPIGVRVEIVRDASEGQGPLAGILAGLGAVATDLAFVTGGDMPELSIPVGLEMLRVADEADVEAVALADEGRFRPLPLVVGAPRARAVAHAALHDGERSLRGFLDRLLVAVLDEATWHALDPERRSLRDIDEPGDLAD